MNLVRNRRMTRPIVHNPVYRSAFARVDPVLAKNSYSEHEKTEFWLAKMFGRPPGKVVSPKRRQRIHPGKSG
jgi:hypothetical protein